MAGKPLDEEAIFKVACKIGSPAARADYLKQACGDDRELLDRVTALLRVHDQEQSFLESPPPGVDATIQLAPITEKPGTVIDRYKLLEQIGEGGVWGGLHGRTGAAGSAKGGLEGHQAGDGHQGGDRPV